MQAWEMAQKIFEEARPVIRSEEEQTWTDNVDVSVFYDNNLSLDWGSNVPGSGAPERIMVAAVQALENRGYRVSQEGYRLLNEGLAAWEEKDFVGCIRYRRCCAGSWRRPEKRRAILTGTIVIIIPLRSTKGRSVFRSR